METHTSADQTCSMCGALRSGELVDKQHRPGAETIHRLALFMQDDWRACCSLLLFVAMQHRSIEIKTRDGIFSKKSICEALRVAAARFPDLAEELGIK